MHQTLKDVLLFHQVFGQLINEDVTIIIPQEVKQLRYNLMSEEYLELIKAENNNDIVEVADGLCDLKYVLNGTIIAHGLHNNWDMLYANYKLILDAYKEHEFRIDDYLYNDNDNFVPVLLKLEYFIECKIKAHGFTGIFPKMFAEVQRSNMSKTCLTEAEASHTVNVRTKEFDCQCEFFENAGRFVVIRSSDRKALKSVNFSKPNLVQFLAKD